MSIYVCFQSVWNHIWISLMKTSAKTQNCNRAELYGAIPGQTPPLHIFCFSSSLEYLHNLMYISWVVWPDAKTPTKWKTLTTWWPWGPSPQTYWSLRIDVNPCDTTLLSYHQPIIELCMSWLHTCDFPLSPGLYKGLLKTQWGVKAFWALAVLDSLYGPYNKHCTFLHHNPMSVD